MERRSKSIAITTALVLGVAIFQTAVRPLPIATTRRLAIDETPAKIAEWTSSGNEPVAAEVKDKLPSAEIIQRTYRSGNGIPVGLVLVTANRNADIHNPLDCFPAQGWTLGNYSSDNVENQRVNTMIATKGRDQMAVYYYYTGYYEAPLSSPLLREVRSMRSKLLGTIVGMSLFVRITGPNTPDGVEAVRAFTSKIVPVIQNIAGPDNRPPGNAIDRPISGFRSVPDRT